MMDILIGLLMLLVILAMFVGIPALAMAIVGSDDPNMSAVDNEKLAAARWSAHHPWWF
jgi:hypothetical protein